MVAASTVFIPREICKRAERFNSRTGAVLMVTFQLYVK